MTSRDLLQQRETQPSGDTAWRLSPLVTAALEGSLAVLDGLHRVNAGTFAVLHRYRVNSDIFVLLLLKVKGPNIALNERTHLRATERHLSYGITQCYLPPDRGERTPP